MNEKCIFLFICLEFSNRHTNISIRYNKWNVGGEHREDNVGEEGRTHLSIAIHIKIRFLEKVTLLIYHYV